jgi:predicted transglutaminase-like cysteine proteinase
MIKLARTLISAVCALTASAAFSQTVVGPDSAPGRYNQLRDLAVRPIDSLTPASPDVFGTAAVGAGVTFYESRFRRVSQADRNDPAVLAIADTLRGLAPAEQLSRVQSEVLAKVRYASDLDTMHVADFWANAGETLQRGAGDSEDIAIVEMQALKAAGFSARDLYLSIGREQNVGTHIVLLAHTADGFTVLDDKIGYPMATRDDHIFTPVLTVGDGKSWIHGRRVGGGGVRLSAR